MMKQKKIIMVAIAAIVTIITTGSCKDSSQEKESPQKKEIRETNSKKVKFDLKQASSPQKKEERITFKKGESLYSKFGNNWSKMAIKYRVPIFDSKGVKKLPPYRGKGYSLLIFPGDYIENDTIFNKDGKKVNFQARYTWKRGCCLKLTLRESH